MSLVVRTLADRIFDLVREKVVSGELAQDQPIRQDALAAEFGVSKIPLREALARLEQENLLVSHANRGYFVRAMSADEAEEIYALRLAIEPAAVGLAARAATDAERAAATAAMDALDKAAAGQAEQVAMRNREFHVALARPCRRVLTVQLIERLQFLSERYTVAHLAPAGRGDRAHDEHNGLLQAWLARDAARAEELAAAHITGTLQDLRQQLHQA
ncbi:MULTISPECIES: GntR family transcriptional regulator [unclassified Novosphingobium]|uniref:GntR family transcriptional regulator n=1 Tax=unclassified Novosphingobium TaxID=2644732 RepID=UPI000D2FE8B0|nr:MULTISPECIES: GntR family transcriptional regulator [unclassified Novosphingobium]PTR07227.1 DNA-binding GntR family transcriptional regulator [Novosphingobium sp. GV055]PUB00040.1 DNA-binding GntR family transcriptional regulator [Novosphingobium sp. GV061]PUB15010.1 DNA-binding GntR family transcriptional regulator [Novosphingobium sp. GV079]PUB39069.1 DNA-binding GntR family transcriptional regulator [Novosphingobium sp. GV027]